MSSTHGYSRESFLSEFYPDASDRAEVEAGAQALVSICCMQWLAEIAERMHVRQESVSAIERGQVDTSLSG